MENLDSFKPEELRVTRPEYMGLSEFEAENLYNLRRAAGNVSLAPTQAEIEAHDELLGSRNFEFMSSIPEILPKTKISVESKTVRWGDFGYEAKIVLKDINLQFNTTIRDGLTHDIAEKLSALRSGIVWLDSGFSDTMAGGITRGRNRHAWGTDVKKLPTPCVIAGARDYDGRFSEVLLLPMRTSNRQGGIQTLGEKTVEKVLTANVFNERWKLLNETFTLYRKTGAITALMSTSQLNNLEALQNVMLGEGLTHDELSSVRQDGGLVVSPETVPVFRIRNRSKKLLRFRRGPSVPSDLKTEEFDAFINGQIEKTIPPETFKDFSVMRWLHRSAIIFDKEQEFKESAERHLANLPESPVDIYLRENGVKTGLELEQ